MIDNQNINKIVIKIVKELKKQGITKKQQIDSNMIIDMLENLYNLETLIYKKLN